MIKFLRRLAARLTEAEDERADRMPHGPLVCKLITDLRYLDDMTRGLAATRR